MNLTKKKLGYVLLAVALGVVVIAGLGVFARPAVAPEGTSGAPHFSLFIDYGDKNDSLDDIPLGERETVFLATQRLVCERGIEFDYEDYGDMGMLVTSIGGRSGGGGVYWQYWINGEYAQVGASAYEIRDGDRIEWRLTNAQQ